MGMDVYGNEPKTDAGEYFRNNVWYWRPLWSYCILVADGMIDSEIGHDNSGDGLDADQAEKLAAILRDELSSGRTADFKRKYDAYLGSLSSSKCDFCGGTGIRTDAVGVEMGMPTKKLDEFQAIAFGRSEGWCNACQGEGKVPHIETNYPFEIENVQEFAEFLENCGGFKIF
jgi:hypothetical protein